MVPLLHFVAPLTALCPMHSKLYRAIQHLWSTLQLFSLILVWEAFKIWLEGFEWQSKKELLKQVPHKMQKHLGMGCKMFYRSTNTIQITNKATKDIPCTYFLVPDINCPELIEFFLFITRKWLLIDTDCSHWRKCSSKYLAKAIMRIFITYIYLYWNAKKGLKELQWP